MNVAGPAEHEVPDIVKDAGAEAISATTTTTTGAGSMRKVSAASNDSWLR
jgi:hypothetical protein